MIAVADRRKLYETLTTRERQIAKMLAFGLTCRAIADDLGIGPKTIDTHRMAIMKKLGLKNTTELARDAIRVGFVPGPDETTP